MTPNTLQTVLTQLEAEQRASWERQAEAAAVAAQDKGLPVPTWPDFRFEPVYTIQLGLAGVPIQAGGAGPDEPTWYFDVKEQFDLAVKAAEDAEVNFSVGAVHEVPEDDLVNDACEFLEYLRMELDAAAGSKKFTEAGRQAYKDKLENIIYETMTQDHNMLRETITEGRTGLNEMDDQTLLDFGQGCYDLDPEPGMLEIGHAPAPT